MKNQSEDRFDQIIKSTLDSKADHVRMSPDLEYKIRRNIYESKKEEKVMKIGMMKKAAVTLAAVCVLGSITAVAAGKVVGYTGSSRADLRQIQSIEDVAEVEKTVGYNIKAVESFANGYALKDGHIVDSQALDEDGNAVDTYKEVFIDYEKDGIKVTLVEQPDAGYKIDSPGHPNRTKIECGDIILTYGVDQYKFVPEGYVPTEDEKAAMEAMELFISYGSSDIIEKEYYSLDWVQDGVKYTFMSNGEGALEAEVLTEMAKELIELEE